MKVQELQLKRGKNAVVHINANTGGGEMSKMFKVDKRLNQNF